MPYIVDYKTLVLLKHDICVTKWPTQDLLSLSHKLVLLEYNTCRVFDSTQACVRPTQDCESKWFNATKTYCWYVTRIYERKWTNFDTKEKTECARRSQSFCQIKPSDKLLRVTAPLFLWLYRKRMQQNMPGSSLFTMGRTNMFCSL